MSLGGGFSPEMEAGANDIAAEYWLSLQGTAKSEGLDLEALEKLKPWILKSMKNAYIAGTMISAVAGVEEMRRISKRLDRGRGGTRPKR